MVSDSTILKHIAGQPKRTAGFKQLVRELGLAGTILLGSDFPNIPYPYAQQIAGLARLELGDAWLRAVCWDNPVAMFGLGETAGGGEQGH